ncbi:MAG: hypothetical protein PHC62_02980 [Candidatus Izemoplasmatales bacterium]|nr:hypothetical protein [Candidatus Izemoplasmatales bacterium]
MTIEEKLLSSDNNKVLDRDDLYQLIRTFYPNYKDTSIRWVIYRLVKNGIISKLDQTKYIIGKTKYYHQQETGDERDKIIHALDQAFPNIRMAVFESTLLNEWVNHQIARKIIFIETEKYFINDVFRYVYNTFPIKTLLNPNNEDLYMYDGELIIVTQLISQAPINQKKKDIKIEKLIVDLYTKDLITEFINEDEKEDVIESIFKTYPVNIKTVYAYAKRRNNLNIIKEVISNYKPGVLS